MSDENFLIDLVLILSAAVGGGMLALLLKQPIILGYIIGGLIIGPFTPGLVANFDQLRFLAEVGLALLLFVLGASMPRSQFRGLGSIILLGGAGQIILTIGLGMLFVPWFGLGLAQGFLLGTILAQSSSAVITKVLDGRRETEAVHGRIALGMSLVQDVSSVPILLLLFVFLEGESATLLSFLGTLGKVFGLAIGAYVLGRIFLPRILERVGRFGSDELTVIITLVMALGGAIAVEAIGLSIAFGAFMAGLVIAESPVRPAALSRIMPLRDVFAAMFFVSIGTLFNPSVLWQLTLPLLGLLGALVIGKAAISTIIVRLFKYTFPVAIMSGLLLGQIGEFAFILANMGLDKGAISQSLFSTVITAAVISISINSLVLDSAPPVLAFLAKVTRFMPLRKRFSESITSLFYSKLKHEDLTACDTDSKLEVEDSIARWSYSVFNATFVAMKRRSKGSGKKPQSIENNDDINTKDY